MSHYVVDGDHLKDIADALRTKTGESGSLAFPEGMLGVIGQLGAGFFGTASQKGSGTNSMTFTGVPREPLAYALVCENNYATSDHGSSTGNAYWAATATWDGETDKGTVLQVVKSGSGSNAYAVSYLVKANTAHSYEDGTLTISMKQTTNHFNSNRTYDLIYIY